MPGGRRQFIARTLGAAAVAAVPLAVRRAFGRSGADTTLTVAAGARIGVVTLLDAEVTHFHAARRLQDGFLKTYTVGWSVSALLVQAVQERLAQLALVPVPVAPGAALARLRERCFLTASLERSLPKPCVAPYTELATRERLGALIVLGPGLNDSTHAGSTRRRELPDYLRGWCLVTREGEANPTLLNLSELLLIGLGRGGAELAVREWGGAVSQSWSGFAAPVDLKALTGAELDALQPFFAALLRQQAAALLEHLIVARQGG